ncbi:MAG: hypothetical protein ABR499_08960 [Gemmatimonadaceae bacterium]
MARTAAACIAGDAARPHSQFIAATERAGDVAVHTVEAKEGVAVTSVIAERDVPPSDVLAAAHELAIAAASGREVAWRSLFDLPLGDSPLWTIEEYEAPMSRRGERAEWCMAVLPAWSAASTHDLARPSLGFPAAAAALGRLTGQANFDYAAAQSVVARYTRTGFVAAAVGVTRFAGGLPPVVHSVSRAGASFGSGTRSRWSRCAPRYHARYAADRSRPGPGRGMACRSSPRG